MSSKTIICIFIICVAIWSFTFGDELRYTINIVEDTVLIGEPIIVKCEITNTGSKATEIYASGSTCLLQSGKVEFHLHIPGTNREYRYHVYENFTIANPVPEFILQANESIYFYITLCWSGALGGWSFREDTMYDHLTLEKLEPGNYRIESRYSAAHKLLISNQDSCYAVNVPEDEAEVFGKIGNLIDKYYNWPEHLVRDDRPRALEIFPGVIEGNSVFAYYCHYILCEISFLKEHMDQNTLTIADDFLRKYPHTPLTEKLSFDLYLYYIRQNKPQMARSTVIKALEGLGMGSNLCILHTTS